jgi:hypothetical protein
MVRDGGRETGHGEQGMRNSGARRTGPVFSDVGIWGYNVPPGDEFGNIDTAIEGSVDHEATGRWLVWFGDESRVDKEYEDVRNQAVGDRVTERHEGECDKRRNCITDVSPIDTGYLTHHHASNLWKISKFTMGCN